MPASTEETTEITPAPGWLSRLWSAVVRAPLLALRRSWSQPRVRQARPDEVVDLRHAVLRAGRPRASAIWEGDRDPEARHWVVEWAGEIVGCVSVMPQTEAAHPTFRWQLRGMAVAPSARGRHLGAALLERVQRDVAAPMWCNARETAAGFYLRHGWEIRGEPFEIPRIGPHVRMFWSPADS